MTKTQKTLLAVGIVLLLVGLVARFGISLLPDSGGEFSNGPFSVCIVERETDRTALSDAQLAVIDGLAFRKAITGSGGTFIGCVDVAALGPGKKPAVSLVPWLKAAEGATPPVLLVQRGTAKIKVYPITDEASARKAVGVK